MYVLREDEETGEHFLDVACGRSFMYNVRVALSPEQAKKFKDDLAKQDTDAMSALAQHVYENPDAYL